MRAVLLIAVLAAAGVFGWKYRDEIPFLRDAQTKIAAPAFKFNNDEPSFGPVPEKPAPGAGSVRRCLQNGTTLYTNDACPPGSKELGVKSGTVSVVPAFKAPPSASAVDKPKSGIPNARELLSPPGEVDIKEKHMERATGG